MTIPSDGGGGSDGPQIVVDVDAAKAYADALRNLAASVNEGADAFGRRLGPVTEEWLGLFRERFDDLASGYLTEAAGLAEALYSMASAIATASEEAVLYNRAVTKARAAHQPVPARPASMASSN